MTRIQLRKDTAANWASSNPILALGETGVETDSRKTKYGDGVTHWNDLSYSTCPVDGSEVPLKIARDTDTNLTSSNPVVGAGEFMYNTTTGGLVCGDGESNWSGLPDIRKQFQNVVTVAKAGKKGSADFICSEYDSDAECIQAALNAAASDNVILILPGIYNIASQISQYYKNITIIGVDRVLWIIDPSVSTPSIEFGGKYINSSILNTDSYQGEMSVTLLDASQILSGDIILISNTDLWCPHDYPTQNTGESYLVTGVTDNIVSLNLPLLRDYPTSKSSTAYIYRPIKVTIINLHIQGSGETAFVRTLNCLYVKDSSISHCEIYNSGINAISAFTSYNLECFSNYIHDCAYDGYGCGIVAADASTDIHIHNNRIERCRHCVAFGTSSHNGLNRDILITTNFFVGGAIDGADLIDCHTPTINYHASDNYFYIQRNGTAACIDGSESLVFCNNHVYNGDAVHRRGKHNGGNYDISHNIIEGGGIYSDSDMESAKESLNIIGNTSKNCINGIKITAEIYNNIDISHNTIDTTSDYAITIRIPRSDAINDLGEVYADHPTSIKLNNNYINNPTYDGILIYKLETGSPINATISGNDITGVNFSAKYNGIHIQDVSDSIISENKISGTYNGLGWPILESELYDTVSGNQIINNILNDSNGEDPSTLPTLIDPLSTTTGWSTDAGTVTEKIIENGRLKITGTTTEDGLLFIGKTFDTFGSAMNFISFYLESTVSAKIKFTLKSGTPYITWQNDSRFSLTANTNTHFIFPSREYEAGATGTLLSELGGTFDPNNITTVVLGIADASIPNTPVTFYVSNIYGLIGNFLKCTGSSYTTQNTGYITENTGTATIPASGASIVVNHGLVAAPTKYFAFPSANLGNCWIDTVTATQMTIHCETAPASDTLVSWSAEV